MTCPKCDSKNGIPAPDENPGWAKQYMKCFSCGMRWDAAGLPPKEERELEDPPERKPSSEDLVALVMKTAREHKPPTKEPIMGSTLGDRQCTFITKHRTRCSQAAAKGATSCKNHMGKVPETANPPVVSLPAKRQAASIVLADPQVINPRPLANGGGRLLSLEHGIEQCEADLAILRSAKEVLERCAG